MNTRTTLIAAVLVTLVVLSGYTTSTSLVLDDLPAHIHLTWQRNNTSHTITVTWQTETSTAGDTVLYDITSRNGSISLYQYSANGTHHTYSGASGYIHHVELQSLTPNKTYYFVCGGDEGGYSSERSFRTATLLLGDIDGNGYIGSWDLILLAVAYGSTSGDYNWNLECDLNNDSHVGSWDLILLAANYGKEVVDYDVWFVAGGDSRTQWWERNKVSQAMSVFNPSFVLFTGDLVENGDSQVQWDNFFDHIHTYWIGQNNLTIPVMPCLGNHEYPFTKYFEQFALPNNEQWYSFNWGPNIHVICLNSETDLTGVLEQTEWLENDLVNHASVPWKIVYFHRHTFPAYHGAFTPGLEYWVPLFDKYHVDIVFNGHSHSYYRSNSINWTASQTEPQPSYANGTVYVISGGWGAPLHPLGEWWGWNYTVSMYHFVLLHVKHNTLHLQAKANTGQTFDEIWIQKS